MNNEFLLEIPESLNRLGEATFIKVPLYKAKEAYRPIYINQVLFAEYISKHKHFNWEIAANILSNLFSNTLNKENATGLQVGWAYCDKQYDPLDLSLSGNRGAGRAYYVGKRFNIKGEKTPLAVATKREYNDGILSMEDGLWETLVANGLQHSFHLSMFSVLAVLKLNQTCTRPYQGQQVILPQVQIIRIDQNGSLDRISHAFYQKKPFKKAELKEISQHFGELEAGKFIERIEHGMWSAGNISFMGHLIDLQTVCAVKGRHPQYSATKYHAENYFGFEYEGQLKILQSLVNFPETNPQEVSYDFLENEMLTCMLRKLLEGFVYLMGFSQQDKIVEKFHDELLVLFEEFSLQARSCYFRKEDLFCNSAISLLLHLYDFSLFFRFFPILKNVGKLSLMDCLKTILGTNIAKDDFSLLGRQELDDNEKYFVTSVLSRFKKQFITKDDGVNNSEIILGFIKKYEHLFDKILAFSQMDLDEVITRAYIINEDRYYMFPACTLSFYLCFNYDKQPEQFTGKLVDLVIKACQRNPGFMLETIANLRIYKEGYSYFLLDGRGKYQIVIVLFAEEGRNPHAEQVEMLFDEKRYIISKSGICDNDVKYCTEKMAINNLIDGFSRNYTINYPKIKIQSEQKEFSLTPLVKIGF